MRNSRILLPAILLAILTACQPVPAALGSQISVVATTSIVADVVQQVGGGRFTVNTLLPLGSDPHSFQPSPRDMALVADASIIFANGAGLEEFLQPLIENAGASARVIEVSDGVQLLEAPPGEIGAGETLTGDPHTWVDPNNVIAWVDNIRAALTVMVALHDLKIAGERFDRVMLLNRRLVGIGSAESVLDPVHLVEAYGGHLRLLPGMDGTLALGDSCCDEGDHDHA